MNWWWQPQNSPTGVAPSALEDPLPASQVFFIIKTGGTAAPVRGGEVVETEKKQLGPEIELEPGDLKMNT